MRRREFMMLLGGIAAWSLLELCISTTVLARDSSRFVCSGFAGLEIDGQSVKAAISIDFSDSRDVTGKRRKYVLSSIYQNRMFQGVTFSPGDSYLGTISLLRGRRTYYVGTFDLDRKQLVMTLEGTINVDLEGRPAFHAAKAKLPCVDLSF